MDVDSLTTAEWRIDLNHTRLYNLFNAADRTDFFKEFVALLRFVAAGEANIGHVRKDSVTIHRSVGSGEELEGDNLQSPPQEVLNEAEKRSWRIFNVHQYTA